MSNATNSDPPAPLLLKLAYLSILQQPCIAFSAGQADYNTSVQAIWVNDGTREVDPGSPDW